MALGGGTRQEGNTVTGDLAARDVNNITNNTVNVLSSGMAKRDTALSRLYRDLRAEVEGDQVLTEYISQLKIFTRTVKNETVIGLDGKLTAAGRAEEIDMAMEMKEMIYGQLRENLFSRVFQLIYATLMGKIFEEFQHWIKPAIDAGMPKAEIDALVYARIITPIAAELDECDGCTEPPLQTVRGMVYFLTGNCHIKWS